jgi:hypothetical protein
MQPGTYQALTDLTIRRMQSNSIGAIFHEPRTVETFAYRAGETFEVPATVNGYYFAGGITAKDSVELAERFGLDRPANVVCVD